MKKPFDVVIETKILQQMKDFFEEREISLYCSLEYAETEQLSEKSAENSIKKMIETFHIKGVFLHNKIFEVQEQDGHLKMKFRMAQILNRTKVSNMMQYMATTRH